MSTHVFHKWAESKPEDLRDGQLLLWRTAHVKFGNTMTMSGCINEMCNGWKNTYHLLPPMTQWDGYRHKIPSDLEWSYDVPEWIVERSKRTDRFGRPSISPANLVWLLDVSGAELLPCPFCGGVASWESCNGFIGSMPHQESLFSVGCCMRTDRYIGPEAAAKRWNTRADTAIPLDDPALLAVVEALRSIAHGDDSPDGMVGDIARAAIAQIEERMRHD